MQLADTHTHLYLPEFDNDRDKVVADAARNGVSAMLMPNIDISSLARMFDAVNRYPDLCHPMAGLHPTSVKEDYLSMLEEIEKLIPDNRFIAIGETGIDLYWDRTFIREQTDSFRRHVKWSIEYDLPIVIHSRESFREIFAVLDEFRGIRFKGVFHAFTGDSETASKAVSLGFKLGIGGIVTFKNSGLDKIVKEAGLENLVLETDSPYLAPVPHRGKRNESSYICIINRKVAEIFNMRVEETASATFRNSLEIFKL